MNTLEDFYDVISTLYEITGRNRNAFTFFKTKISDKSFTTIYSIREVMRFNLCYYEKVKDETIRAINASVIEDLKNLWAYMNGELTYATLLKKYVIGGETEESWQL